jgi:phospho-N-acetylmuramoyl-pentapeptide-transferase
MIYHLVEYFKQIGIDIPGQGLFGYLSFRAIAAFTTALLISIFAGRRIIEWLQKKQIGETIRDLGLEGQMQKKGTPTMGGIIIFISLIIPVLLFGDLTNIYTILLLISTAWFFFLGFTDDYIKVFKKNKDGLSEKKKLLGQGAMALAIGLAVCFSDQIVVREDVSADSRIETSVEQVDMVKSTKTTIPFVKDHEFDYKWLSPFKGAMGWYCKWAIYVLMIIIVITACSNGVNLTDGMDGLAAGTSAIVGVVLGVFAWLGGNIVNADYLNIMYIPGSGELVVFAAAFVGALVGFLWYNAFPAQIFMGDTGSLSIGGVIAVMALCIRKELLLPLLCGIFLVESLSVMIQVSYFKHTKKKYGEGRRIFLMSPLHHHYQKRGFFETKIVLRFWIISLLLAALTLVTLKIR